MPPPTQPQCPASTCSRTPPAPTARWSPPRSSPPPHAPAWSCSRSPTTTRSPASPRRCEAADRARASRVVPAIEISAIDDGGERGAPRELHILGYLIDHTDPTFTATLEAFLADREQRTLRMAQSLRELGFELDEDTISARVSAGEPIGRPHLAEAALSPPRQRTSACAKRSIDDIGSFIRAYLIEGRPAFSLRVTPTVAQAIEAIHGAGGVAIWAHPFWDVSDPAEVLAMIDRFRALGIDGVEAFYVTHTQEQTELLANRCAELGMLSTGSADFHGPENRLFSRFMAFDTHGLTPNLGPIAQQSLTAQRRASSARSSCRGGRTAPRAPAPRTR